MFFQTHNQMNRCVDDEADIMLKFSQRMIIGEVSWELMNRLMRLNNDLVLNNGHREKIPSSVMIYYHHQGRQSPQQGSDNNAETSNFYLNCSERKSFRPDKASSRFSIYRIQFSDFRRCDREEQKSAISLACDAEGISEGQAAYGAACMRPDGDGSGEKGRMAVGV